MLLRLLFIALITPLAVVAQKKSNPYVAVLMISLTPNPEIDSICKANPTEIVIYAYDTALKAWSNLIAERELKYGERRASFQFAKEDLLRVGIRTNITIHINQDCVKTIGKGWGQGTAVRPGKTVILETMFPPSCSFDKTIFNNACPKCYSADHVVPLFYGDTMLDPLTGSPCGDYKIADKDATGCDPNWYCGRDSLAF